MRRAARRATASRCSRRTLSRHSRCRLPIMTMSWAATRFTSTGPASPGARTSGSCWRPSASTSASRREAAFGRGGAAAVDHRRAQRAGPRAARLAGADPRQPAVPGPHAGRYLARGRLAAVRDGRSRAHPQWSRRGPYRIAGTSQQLPGATGPARPRPALEQLTEQLARETGMHVFFQKDCRAPSLSGGRDAAAAHCAGGPDQRPQAFRRRPCASS